MSYDEVRFAGIGLIDLFIHDSNDFETRELQSQQSNYLVASAGSYQYLYAFKRYQKVEEDQDEKASQTHSQYMFDVVKINHIENVGHQTSQVNQIISFMKNLNDGKLHQFPSIRINSQYKGVISTWFNITEKDKAIEDFMKYESHK